MIEWLGIVCVAWTATELLRMSAAALQSAPASPRNATAPASRTGPRSKRFAAWDDHGRPIDVEDLGPAARSR